MLTGDNGILTQAQNAKNRTAEAEAQERADLAEQNALIENLVGGGTGSGGSAVKPGERVESTSKNNYTDTNGDKATVPGGFTVSGIDGEQKVSEGLVIYDIPDGVTPNWTEDKDGIEGPDIKTKYNQFVWIPVASESDYQRDFSYPINYDEKLETTPEGSTFTDESGYLPDGIKPETENSENNETAERTAVLKYNGFYIGRYESGKDTDNTTVVTRQNATVYTSKTQIEFKDIAKKMYSNGNGSVKSALCSGIQWDMVMHFVDQKMDGTGEKIFDVRVADSDRHTGSKAESGKNINDKVQNIYDLEGNCWEWVAEKNNTSNQFVGRGGTYGSVSNNRDSVRYSSDDGAYSTFSFRSALYIM